jgi:hypothetical protein
MDESERDGFLGLTDEAEIAYFYPDTENPWVLIWDCNEVRVIDGAENEWVATRANSTDALVLAEAIRFLLHSSPKMDTPIEACLDIFEFNLH